MTSAAPKTEVRFEPRKTGSRSPWAWVPSLYLAEGLPYVVVMTVSVIMYKGMGISNTEIALYTSWLYLPWVIKPLWSPVVDILKTRRLWIWAMQLLIGAGLAGVALSFPSPYFFRYSLAFLWLLAFSSATHDIAADGFYMLATTEKEQAFFVGIRSTFYRVAMISGQGLLVILAGVIQSHTGLPKVELTVKATPGSALVQTVAPGTATELQSGDLRVLALPLVIDISPEPRGRDEVSNLVAAAHALNSAIGVYGQPQTTAQGKGQNVNAGNVGIAYVHLSKPPGKPVTVTVAEKPSGVFGFFKTAGRSVSVIEGARLLFNDQNWNKPAAVMFQLDPKERGALSTTYELRSGDIAFSWAVTFGVLVLLFLLFGIYHRCVLPRPEKDRSGSLESVKVFLREFLRTFVAYFSKDKIGVLLLFLLFYRFAEAQLVKMVAPFLLDGRELGGLGLTTGQVGFVYGTIGVVALTCGGLLGGMLVSRRGLKSWLWPMVLIMHLPDLAFVYLAYTQPQSFTLINLCVAVEQFGYGFGFTAYMLYMIYIARGSHETAHYAICTGFMALGMMLPGMFSGWLQDQIGYRHFFLWVMLATLPGFLVVAFVPLDAEFGRKGLTSERREAGG